MDAALDAEASSERRRSRRDALVVAAFSLPLGWLLLWLLSLTPRRCFDRVLAALEAWTAAAD